MNHRVVYDKKDRLLVVEYSPFEFSPHGLDKEAALSFSCYWKRSQTVQRVRSVESAKAQEAWSLANSDSRYSAPADMQSALIYAIDVDEGLENSDVHF